MSDREAMLRWNDSRSTQSSDNSSQSCDHQDIQSLAKKKKPPPFDVRHLTEKKNLSQKKQHKKSFSLSKKKKRHEKKFTEGSFNPYCMHAPPPDYTFTLHETGRFVGDLPCDEGITAELLRTRESKEFNHSLQSFVTSEMQECFMSEKIGQLTGTEKKEDEFELFSFYERHEIQNKDFQEQIGEPSSHEKDPLHDVQWEEREKIEIEDGDKDIDPLEKQENDDMDPLEKQENDDMDPLEKQENDDMDPLEKQEREEMPKTDNSFHVPFLIEEKKERFDLTEKMETPKKIDLSVKDIGFHSLDGLANVVLQAHKEMQGEQTTEVIIPIAGTEECIQVTLTTYKTAPTEYNLALTGMPPSAVVLALKKKAALIELLASRGIRVHQLLLSECGRHNKRSVRKTSSQKNRISNTIFKNGTSK